MRNEGGKRETSYSASRTKAKDTNSLPSYIFGFIEDQSEAGACDKNAESDCLLKSENSVMIYCFWRKEKKSLKVCEVQMLFLTHDCLHLILCPAEESHTFWINMRVNENDGEFSFSIEISLLPHCKK